MKFSITTFLTDESIAPGPLGAAVEERGFHALMVTEHSHMPLAYEPPYPGAGDPPREFYRTLDPFVALASAAATTQTLALRTGVILLSQRDVIYTAKEVATLDLVSDGRVVLGVGVGWNRHEMRHHGLDPATRGAKLNEQIRALKMIWTQETAEFHGDFVDFSPIFSWPKPVQQPHPPIYVGGTSKAALRRLCSLGDGWLPPAGLALDKVLGAREWLAANGRPDVPITIYGVRRDRKHWPATHMPTSMKWPSCFLRFRSRPHFASWTRLRNWQKRSVPENAAYPGHHGRLNLLRATLPSSAAAKAPHKGLLNLLSDPDSFSLTPAGGWVAWVRSVAYHWGFTNLGRFAAAHTARYDEPPAATLRRRAFRRSQANLSCTE